MTLHNSPGLVWMHSQALHGTRKAMEPHALSLSAACLGLAGVVWLGDFATGADVAFTLFYLAPIGLAVWCIGAPAGISLSVLAALGCFAIRAGAARMSSGALTWNTLGELGTFVVFSLTLDALRRRLDAQTELALSDPLTGLGNRRALHAALSACARSAPLTMICLDIDGFKRVNDEQGHARGDDLLVLVARSLRGALREGDVAVRLGGDEFGVVLPGASFAEAARVLARLGEVFQGLSEGPFAVTMSVGAVTFASSPGDAHRIVATTDRVMYCSKRAGGAHTTHELVPTSVEVESR